MKLTQVFINRPIFASMVILALVVLGYFSFLRLGVDLFPEVDFPVVMVTTDLLGASPEEVETEISKRIEEQINTIAGLDELQSFSYDGRSLVVAQFVLEKNGDVAAEEVRDRVNRVVSKFPFGTKSPVIQKFDVASSPIMQVALYGDVPIRELTLVAKKRVKELLETVSGVGNIDLIGGQEREIHVYIDPVRLSAHRLSITDVESALKRHNLELPGGRLTEEPRELVVRTMGKIYDSNEFSLIPVATAGGTPIYVRDVAVVEDTEQERRTFSRLDGVPCISLLIKKQTGMNTVSTAESLVKKIGEIKKTLPPNVNIKVIEDQSEFILSAVHSLEEDIVLGAILVSLTVLLFLRNVRGMIICAVSIPASLIATFTLMDMLGFTLNNLTLLALSLATGIVIDDAIIVLENIFRHIEELKESPREAAAKAVAEIGMAVVSTTLSLMVIFVPLAFMKGIVGRFMFSFGMTMVFAIGVSLIFAFVLTPTMSSRLLKVKNVHSARDTSRDTLVNRLLDRYYTRMLKWVLAHRKAAVAGAVVIMFLSVPAVMIVGKDFIPKDDRSEFNIHIKAPEGTSVNEMDELLATIEGRLKKIRGVVSLLTTVGGGQNQKVSEADIYVKLIDLEERSYDQKDVMTEARVVMSEYPFLRTSVQDIGGVGGGSHSSFVFRLTGPNIHKLRSYTQELMEKMREKRGFVDIDSSFEFGKPEVRVLIDRQRAADLGVSADDVAGALQLFVSGEKDITKFQVEDDLYEVRVRLLEEYRKRPMDLLSLTIPTSVNDKGEKPRDPVRLDQVATIEETVGPSEIQRYQRQRTIEVNANLENFPIDEAKQFILSEASKIDLDPGYDFAFVGQAKYMKEMQENFVLAFIQSILFMFIILASLFESLLHPVTILISLPLTFPFAVFSLIATHSTLHIISILGLFLLIGIVKKNSILQVDYTNTLRAQGMERHEALIQASRTRLRPIMMTTLTLVASMIPVALSQGPGSATRSPMAIVIIGGQTLCLLVTLLLTPVFYSIFDDVQTIWIPKLRSRMRLIVVPVAAVIKDKIALFFRK